MYRHDTEEVIDCYSTDSKRNKVENIDNTLDIHYTVQ